MAAILSQPQCVNAIMPELSLACSLTDTSIDSDLHVITDLLSQEAGCVNFAEMHSLMTRLINYFSIYPSRKN